MYSTKVCVLWVRGCDNLQLLPSPNSFMYCFTVSVECQCLLCPAVCEQSSFGSSTILKSPAMIILVASFSFEKILWKKEGSLLGPYMFTIVNLWLDMVPVMMTYCPPGQLLSRGD